MAIGLGVMGELVDAEVTEIAGAKGRHDAATWTDGLGEHRQAPDRTAPTFDGAPSLDNAEMADGGLGLHIGDTDEAFEVAVTCVKHAVPRRAQSSSARSCRFDRSGPTHRRE